jgi:hypothetical protein
MALTAYQASFKEWGVPVSWVPSREWLEFEGDAIASLFAQTESALARRGRSRHENGSHKSDGGSGRRNAFPWGRLDRSLGSRGADPLKRTTFSKPANASPKTTPGPAPQGQPMPHAGRQRPGHGPPPGAALIIMPRHSRRRFVRKTDFSVRSRRA